MILFFGIPLKVYTTIDGITLTFVTTSITEFSLRARESFYREKVTMYWLRNVIQLGDVVYDIGANVGAYSLYAGRRLQGRSINKSGKVYAFEPAFSNFFPLCRNIEANNLNSTITPFPLALGNDRYETRFFLQSTTTGEALHGLGYPKSEGSEFEAKFQQGISVTPLDLFVENSDIRFPNHLKVDVDGSELDIIKGATSVLKDPRLKSIMIEINTDLSQGAIESNIFENGFELVKQEQWQGKNTFNMLFLRKEHISAT